MSKFTYGLVSPPPSPGEVDRKLALNTQDLVTVAGALNSAVNTELETNQHSLDAVTTKMVNGVNGKIRSNDHKLKPIVQTLANTVTTAVAENAALVATIPQGYGRIVGVDHPTVTPLPQSSIPPPPPQPAPAPPAPLPGITPQPCVYDGMPGGLRLSQVSAPNVGGWYWGFIYPYNTPPGTTWTMPDGGTFTVPPHGYENDYWPNPYPTVAAASAQYPDGDGLHHLVPPTPCPESPQPPVPLPPTPAPAPPPAPAPSPPPAPEECPPQPACLCLDPDQLKQILDALHQSGTPNYDPVTDAALGQYPDEQTGFAKLIGATESEEVDLKSVEGFIDYLNTSFFDALFPA